LVALESTLERIVARGDRVAVVSVMAVNNEVGTITPMRDVARIVRAQAPRAVLHSDAVQAACWCDLRDIVLVTDVVSLSAHKFGGPKGMGVMVQKSGVALEPLIMGGGQERDRRSGTTNVAGIVATAVALRATIDSRDAECRRIAALKTRMVAAIRSQLDDVIETVPNTMLNNLPGADTQPAADTVPGIAHLCFGGVESEALLFLLDEAGVCASAASACASGAMETSHVLRAMNVEPHYARGALRLSLGHTTTEHDVEVAINAVVQSVTRLRSNSQ
jgi:cysteine desulfurase